MESRYAATPALVADIPSDMLETPTLEIQESEAVQLAVGRYRKGGVDLHDCLLVALAAVRKARVVTFDAKAAKKLGMDLLV